MTADRPEVVAWYTPTARDTLPVVALNDRSQRGEPLIRLSDYEALQANYGRLLKHLQNLIDQTTPLEPEPGNPMWSRRIQLDEVIAERDSLRAECEKLRTCLAETAGVAVTMLYESHRQDTIKEFGVTELTTMVDCTKHLAGANAQVEKIYRKAWNMAQGCAGPYLEGVKP